VWDPRHDRGASFDRGEQDVGCRRPPDRSSPIDLKWVFKTKKDESRCVVKHKAQLVTKGYVQRLGVDFEEVFTLVVRMESVCTILAGSGCARGMVRAPQGREVGLPQWRPRRRGVRLVATRVLHWQGRLSACTEQGSVWASMGTAGVVCQAARVSELPRFYEQRPQARGVHRASGELPTDRWSLS
jgi:hypothetical protein